MAKSIGSLGRVAVLLCLAAAGCASSTRSVRLPDAARGRGWVRVENIDVVRQTKRESCGAAALAMVLQHWGRSSTEDEIWASSPPPDGQGMRADALRDFARRQGLQAFVVEGVPADLEREVSRDRPVVVGVVRREGRYAFRHYEVVAGINPERKRILTLDPARGARESTFEAFANEWAGAGNLTLVVIPGSSPAQSPVALEPSSDGTPPVQ